MAERAEIPGRAMLRRGAASLLGFLQGRESRGGTTLFQVESKIPLPATVFEQAKMLVLPSKVALK